MNCPLCGRFMRKEHCETDYYNKLDRTWWVCEHHKPAYRAPEEVYWKDLKYTGGI